MAKSRKGTLRGAKKIKRRRQVERPSAARQRLDHKILDRFLAHVLDSYRAGTKTQATAIADLAHLAAALDRGPGYGDDPNRYMEAIIEGEGDD